jgi:hypothetical protein
VGLSIAEIEARFGKPLNIVSRTSRRYLIYSGRSRDASYSIRTIGLDASNRVNNIVDRWDQE